MPLTEPNSSAGLPSRFRHAPCVAHRGRNCSQVLSQCPPRRKAVEDDRTPQPGGIRTGHSCSRQRRGGKPCERGTRTRGYAQGSAGSPRGRATESAREGGVWDEGQRSKVGAQGPRMGRQGAGSKASAYYCPNKTTMRPKSRARSSPPPSSGSPFFPSLRIVMVNSSARMPTRGWVCSITILMGCPQPSSAASAGESVGFTPVAAATDN
jgi:hypothetical protein